MDQYQPSFFDEAERLETLTKLKDPLVDLKRLVDFEIFRPQLAAVFTRERTSSAGRKAFDVVFMFKILVLQRLYNLSDEQLEYHINDRHSFQRFLGLRLGSRVPDFSTVWRFREALTQAEAVPVLFAKFTEVLAKRGIITKVGTIVDASFVEVPRQRNTREENALIKEGEVPADWKKQPHKVAQKDVDARWTRKGQTTVYGYKNHVKADAASVVITGYRVTHAAAHDASVLPELLADSAGENLFADGAYPSAKTAELLGDLGITNNIHEKGCRHRPLDDLHLHLNHLKSKIRCRVEHIFGCIENSMGGSSLEYIGLKRNTTGIGLSNLTYNLLQYVRLVRLKRVRGVA